jgi:sec-independent protein translocase protein TatC
MTESKEPYKKHLKELLGYLKPVALQFIILLIAGYIISPHIIQFFKESLAVNIIAIHPYEIFVTRIKIGLYIATVVTMPMLTAQMIRFFKPALTSKEYKTIIKAVPVLFITTFTGLTLGMYTLLTLATGFLKNMATGTGVANSWTLSNIVSYTAKLSIASAIILNIPIAIITLVKAGIINTSHLEKYRPHAMIASLLLAAILSPPDLVTMGMLAAPTIIFYESGLRISQYLENNTLKNQDNNKINNGLK